tara:strand:- start:318 stop:422 length:105 start_codon:yes stop_codon:yes gene_type:complete
MEKYILIACISLLIYFLLKRIEDKKNENFEDREN